MTDEARSDVALSIAALVFGPLLLASLRGGSTVLGVALDTAVILTLTALVPLLLSRTRGDGAAAFALDRSAGPLDGLVLAVPVAAAGVIAMLDVGTSSPAALLGRLSGSLLQLLPVLGLSAGTLLLVTFLAVRGSQAFGRSPEWTLRRLLRTFGMGAAALALVAGLVRVPLGASSTRVIANAVALAILVLAADRMLDGRSTAPRLAVLLPAGLALYLHLTSLGLAVGVQAGALAAGTTVVMAVVTLGRPGARPLIPLALALHVWPTCLSPLTLARGLC
jgi:hypothetical protein